MIDRLAIGRNFWERSQRRLFSYNAEIAHQNAIKDLRALQHIPGGLRLLSWLFDDSYSDQPLLLGGVPWRNPVGLAAGFDKHAEVIPALDALGFGNAEIGTVPPKSQPGNDRPRVWRFPKALAIVNRYGFPSVGAQVVADRIAAVHRRYKIRMSITISIGANKATPIEHQPVDYIRSYEMLRPVLRPQDALKINTSSPNTPGLRKAFKDPDAFLGTIHQGMREFGWSLPNLYLKVPPDDMSEDELRATVEACAKYGYTALEATNTTLNQFLLKQFGIEGVAGVSGMPLFERSNQTLALLKPLAEPYGIDLIGVGGIMSGRDALTKRRLGAKAVQVYTGFVYKGPALKREILKAWKETA